MCKACPQTPRVFIPNCVGNPARPYHLKSCFVGKFQTHQQNEGDVLGSSTCGKDLKKLFTSKLHTKPRLKFLKESVSPAQSTKEVTDRLQWCLGKEEPMLVL